MPKSRDVGGPNRSYFGNKKRKKDYDAADDWRKPKNKWDKKQEDMDDEDDEYKDIFE